MSSIKTTDINPSEALTAFSKQGQIVQFLSPTRLICQAPEALYVHFRRGRNDFRCSQESCVRMAENCTKIKSNRHGSTFQNFQTGSQAFCLYPQARTRDHPRIA